MTDRLALLGLSLLTMAGSRAPRPDPGATLSGSGEVTFVNTSGLVRVTEGEEAVMECVTRNLANNHLVSHGTSCSHGHYYVLLRISDIWADKIFVSGNIEAADGDHLSGRDNHLPCNELLVWAISKNISTQSRMSSFTTFKCQTFCQRTLVNHFLMAVFYFLSRNEEYAFKVFIPNGSIRKNVVGAKNFVES